MQKIDLCERLHEIIAVLIPLYLEGTAFTVYDQLNDHLKEYKAAIKMILRDAVGQNKSAAYY